MSSHLSPYNLESCDCSSSLESERSKTAAARHKDERISITALRVIDSDVERVAALHIKKINVETMLIILHYLEQYRGFLSSLKKSFNNAVQ